MKRTLLSVLLFIMIVWCAGLIYFGYSINHYHNDINTHTDAIITLTGGRNRIIEAVKLLNSGKADFLFISGVDKHTSLRSIQKTQKIKTSMLHRIDIGHMATNTETNAEEAQIWISNKHVASVRLVTSNYHMARAVLEFKHLMPELDIIPHPVYSERIEKKWWTSWQTFSLIFKEYNKLVFKLVKYQLYL